jgi:hypothetical protein
MHDLLEPPLRSSSPVPVAGAAFAVLPESGRMRSVLGAASFASLGGEPSLRVSSAEGAPVVSAPWSTTEPREAVSPEHSPRSTPKRPRKANRAAV